MNKGYTATEVPVSHHAARIQGVWSRNLAGLAGAAAQAKLQLGYVDNPAGSGAVFLLTTGEADGPAGVICLHCRRLHLGDAVLEAGNLADYAVDKALRSLGPALILMKRAIQAGRERCELLYGLPNRTSSAVCRRAGLQAIGTVHRHARVLSSAHPRLTRLPAPWRLWLAPSIVLGLRVVSAVRTLSLRPRLHIAPTTFDDPAIDELWARRPRDLLVSERSGAMLQWRYGRPGRGDWQLALARETGGAIAGYVVWRLHAGAADVGDFFSAHPQRQTAALFNAFSRWVRRRGAHSVTLEYFGNAAVESGLRQAGFKTRGPGDPVVIAPLPEPGQHLGDAALWYLTPFDNDAN